MKQKKVPIVEVKWKDSWTNEAGNWTVEKLKKEPDLILTSVGYLLHRDKRGINITREYQAAEKVGRHVQHIPAQMILSVKKLGRGV